MNIEEGETLLGLLLLAGFKEVGPLKTDPLNFRVTRGVEYESVQVHPNNIKEIAYTACLRDYYHGMTLTEFMGMMDQLVEGPLELDNLKESKYG